MNLKFSAKLFKIIQKNLPFALYRKPTENIIWLLVQDNSGKNEFLMHSFDSNLEKSISDVDPVSISQDEFNFDFELDLTYTKNQRPKTQAEYEALIQKTVERIKKSDIQKIVISRNKQIENKRYNLLKSFQNLLYVHPSSFVYLWHNPKEETWMGATPELLLEQRDNKLYTVSLAGTKLPNLDWSEKEYVEQKIVTDYIIKELSGLDNMEVEGPETVQTGDFQHLKSYISVDIPNDFNIKSIVDKLHPTPAVCGLPKQESFSYIIDNEGYSREFYTGYISVKNEESTRFYVNLRSTQVFQNQLFLYVGGGITADSIAEKEWEETELKSEIILNSLVR